MPMKTIWIWTPKEDWRSKSFDWLPKVSRKLFYSDTAAGFAAGLVALPVAVALGIASGVTPEEGIYSAIVGGFLVSITGGSTVQISGPCGALVVLLGQIHREIRNAGSSDRHSYGGVNPGVYGSDPVGQRT